MKNRATVLTNTNAVAEMGLYWMSHNMAVTFFNGNLSAKPDARISPLPCWIPSAYLQVHQDDLASVFKLERERDLFEHGQAGEIDGS